MTDPPTTRLDAAIAALAAGPLTRATVPVRPFRQIDHRLEAARQAVRPVEARAVPEVGDRLRYRHNLDEDPVPAVVLEVEDAGRNSLRLLTALTDGRGPMVVRTREARVEGSPGWLPLP